MNGSSFEPMIDHFGRVCDTRTILVAYVFEFSCLAQVSSRRIILVACGVLRGCIPDSVSLRFEFSFIEPILGSFWRMLRGCAPDSVSLRFRI